MRSGQYKKCASPRQTAGSYRECIASARNLHNSGSKRPTVTAPPIATDPINWDEPPVASDPIKRDQPPAVSAIRLPINAASGASLTVPSNTLQVPSSATPRKSPRARSSSPGSLRPEEDELSIALNSLLPPLLNMVQKHVIAHIDACFQQQQQTLQPLLDAKKKKQAALQEAEKQMSCIAGSSEDAIGLRSANAMPCVVPVFDAPELAASAAAPTNDGTSAVRQTGPVYSLRTPLLPNQPGAQTEASTTSFDKCSSLGTDGQGSGLPDHLKEISKSGADARMDTLFPKVQDLKDSVLHSLTRKQYDVEQLYKETGLAQKLARNVWFQQFVLFVVVLNTVWIGIETDYNKADLLVEASPLFQIADNLFCVVFTVDILVRFLAFKDKSDAKRDPWFVFDTVLVTMMVWEVWVMAILFETFGFAGSGAVAKDSQVFRMLRLIRLVRVARTARLLQSSPELIVLARGMVAGVRSVFTVMCFLLLFIYVFGVVFTMMMANSVVKKGFFETVPMSMNTLMHQVIAGPDTSIMSALLAASALQYCLFLAFIFFSNLTLMNMLIGILCDVVSTTSANAKDESFLKEVESQIGRLASTLDIDGDGLISKAEFNVIINDPEMTSSFDALGVDIVAVSNFARFVFTQCDAISYTDFAALVGEFRCSKAATIKDVMELRRYLTVELLSLAHGLSAQ